jgi:hypothetical protein
MKPTSVQVLPTPAASRYGSPVQFDAAVTSAFGGVPTGSVFFSAGVTALGRAPLGAGGDTTAGPSAVLDAGATVTASYGGDSAFEIGTGALQPDILPAQTTTALSSSAPTAASGSAPLLTASVSNTSTAIVPFGSVQFSVNGIPVLALQVLDPNGHASIHVQLPDGAYEIGAGYRDPTSATPDFIPGQSALRQVFGSIPTYTGPVPASNLFVFGRPLVSRSETISISAQSTDAGTFAAAARVLSGSAPKV